MRAFTLLAALLPRLALAANGLANPGFEAVDSTWTWLTSGADVVARVASPAEGVTAHSGSFFAEMKRTSTIGAWAAAIEQVVPGATYRGGVGTLSFFIYSMAAIASNSSNQVVYVSILARDASNAVLARDDIAVAGSYLVASDWDKTQVRTINGGTWTPVTLNVRSVLDGKLGANLAAVDNVRILLRINGATSATVFWDDVTWPQQTAGPLTASPAAGAYIHPQNVALSCGSPSPVIHYTIDGSTPTSNSPIYSSPIPITSLGTTTVKAFCRSAGYPDSEVSIFGYTYMVNGLTNPGFEENDSTWTWTTYQADVVARVGSPADGVTAREGSFQTEMKCTAPPACAANVYQIISGATYRGSTGILLFSIYSTSTITNNSNSQIVYVSVIARDASNAVLARDDIVVAGSYSVASGWDTTQVRTINGGTWTPVALNVRSVLDGKLGANLTAVNNVMILLRIGRATNSTITVFWDDVAWPLQTAGPLTALPAAGTYTSPQNVRLSCGSPSPVIHYTVDGSTPTSNSPVYSSPIPIASPGMTTVKAICQSAGYVDSPSASFTYALSLTAATPTATPGPGSYGSPQYISLSCSSPNPTIRYTTDGSLPTSGSAIFSAPFQLMSSATVRAICQSAGYLDSSESSFVYSFPVGLCVSGAVCDDGDPCTFGDTCDILEHCAGTRILCLSDNCTLRSCNGTSSCAVSYASPSTACNDDNACTYDDRCNGAGGCSGTPVSCSAFGPCQVVQCNGTSWCSTALLEAGTSCSTAPDVCGQVCDGVSPYCQPAE